jgi:ribosomal protein S18 acetylase RimI-like enzyme
MTVLAPMRPAVFGAYLDHATAGYAQDNVAAGRWPQEGALERARADFEASLPQGLATPDNYLFEIRAGDAGPTVGSLWFAVEQRHGARCAFVYDVEIGAAWRRQGHALRAFQALESLVAELGIATIGLHVFAHNADAQALYAKLGYGVTGLNMAKHLGAPPP